MSSFPVYSSVAPHSWLQHHVPWLGLLALMFGLLRDEPSEIGFDPDDLNG